MNGAAGLRRDGRRRVAKLAGLAALILLLLAAMVTLGLDVRHRLTELERSTSDNSQWVVLQTEVEAMKLQLALVAAEADPTPARLDDVRLWFDILYSRITLIATSPTYHMLLALPDFAAGHERISRFLEGLVPLIDGPDVALIAALPRVSAALPPERQAARDMTLLALAKFADASDQRRAEIARTLTGLAATTALLVVALSVLAFGFARLWQRGQVQADVVQASRQRLQTIITTSADAIVVTNRGGWIVEFNPAAEATFGYPREAAIGQNAMSLFFPPEVDEAQRTALARQATATRAGKMTPFRIELEVMRGDGRRLPVEVSIAATALEKGGVVVAFVRDISDRKAAESALREARDRALAGERAKADFIAVMSHEMRTPLNGLLGSMAMMDEAALAPDQRELLAMMRISGQILLDHVNSVLDLSRAEAGQAPVAAQAFDADRLVADCMANQKALATEGGNRMALHAPGGAIGWVTGDPVRLRQVLLNLIGNAVKFTRAGTITIEAERLPPGEAIDGVPAVEFRVIDSGPGIALADLDRVFEDFVTLDASYGRTAGGTGLGLGISRRLAEAMGGSLGAESEPGDGSLFWLRLPLPPAAPAGAQAPRVLPEGGAGRSSVLVIEDNEINRRLVVRLLSQAGHPVAEAGNGRDALALASQAAFDVILTDISMPEMDGLEVARRIRAGAGGSARARIVALTAHALPEERERFRAAGIDDCLIKPVMPAALLAAVAGAVEPLVDAGLLEDLRSRLGAGPLDGLLDRLRAEGAGLAEAVAMAAGPEAAREPCHRLAGSAATFGLRRLAGELQGIETLIKTGRDDPARRAGVPALWRASLAGLEAMAVA